MAYNSYTSYNPCDSYDLRDECDGRCMNLYDIYYWGDYDDNCI